MNCRFIKRMKNWKIGDYFRQFSIVTAGIVVTFVGSTVISNVLVEKEVKTTMNLIISELENNKVSLNNFINKHKNNISIASYLIENNFDVRKINADTLTKYQSFISSLSKFTYNADAMDVLKESSLMQKIENKDLLLDLIVTYQGFQNVKESVNEYFDLKRSIIVPLALTSKPSHSDDIFDSYESMLSAEPMKNFCVITIGFFDPTFLEDQNSRVDETIQKLKWLYQ